MKNSSSSRTSLGEGEGQLLLGERDFESVEASVNAHIVVCQEEHWHFGDKTTDRADAIGHGNARLPSAFFDPLHHMPPNNHWYSPHRCGMSVESAVGVSDMGS